MYYLLLIVSLVLSTAVASAQTTAPTSKPDFAGQLAGARELIRADRSKGVAALADLVVRLEAESKSHPQDDELAFHLGRACFYLEDDQRAIEELDRAISLKPGIATYHFFRGVVHRYGKQASAAAGDFKRAVEIDPKHADAWSELGALAIDGKDLDSAIEAFQKVVALRPEESDGYAYLGGALSMKGEFEKALAALERATELEPSRFVTWTSVGQINQQLRRHEKSAAAYEKARDLRPDDWRVAAKLVQCYTALGNIKQRDAARTEVLGLYKSGKIDQEQFCREQFRDGEDNVLAFEKFELTSPLAVRYVFYVAGPDGKTKYRLSLGSYDTTTEIARELKEIGPDARAWHLDGYYPQGLHKTFAMYNEEPTYENTRKTVVEVVQNKRSELSSTSPGDGIKINIPNGGTTQPAGSKP